MTPELSSELSPILLRNKQTNKKRFNSGLQNVDLDIQPYDKPVCSTPPPWSLPPARHWKQFFLNEKY